MTHKMPYASFSNKLFFFHLLCPLISALQNIFFVFCTGWPRTVMSWSPVQEKSLLAASRAAGGGWLGLHLHWDFAGLAFHMKETAEYSFLQQERPGLEQSSSEGDGDWCWPSVASCLCGWKTGLGSGRWPYQCTFGLVQQLYRTVWYLHKTLVTHWCTGFKRS